MLTDISFEEYLIDEIPLGTLNSPSDIMFPSDAVCCELVYSPNVVTTSETVIITIF